jgi:hypothetical protein
MLRGTNTSGADEVGLGQCIVRKYLWVYALVHAEDPGWNTAACGGGHHDQLDGAAPRVWPVDVAA